MKNKRDLLFLGVGILLFGILIATVFYSISFLVSKINAALNIKVENDNRLVRIELEGLKNIQITEETENAAEIKNATTTDNAIKENINM